MYFSFGNENKVFTTPAQSTPNTTINAKQLIEIIKSEAPPELAKLRQILKHGFDNGIDAKTLKKRIKPYKNNLPYFLPSGTCPKHHNDKTLKYNGVIQIDIDIKERDGNIKILPYREKLQQFEFVVFVATSPSSYGIKALIKTNNFNKEHHKIVSKAIIEKLSFDLQLDTKYFDVLGASQPCFIPYDTDVYFNKNASSIDALNIVLAHEKSKMQKQIEALQRQKARSTTSHRSTASHTSKFKNDIDILEYLTNEIEANNLDLTNTFSKWCAVAFSCASVGNSALSYFHRIAKCNPSYDANENDKLFADALKNGKAHQHLGYLINECKNENINLAPIFEAEAPRAEAPRAEAVLRKIELSTNEYLSGAISEKSFSIGANILHGGCGIGKTYFVANSFERVVIISRNVTTLQNYAKYGFVRFTLKAAEKSTNFNENTRITVTFKSLKYLLNGIDVKQFVFVFDEAHLLNEAFSKVSAETKYCYDVIKKLCVTNKVILMSANEIEYNASLQIKKHFSVTKPSIKKTAKVFYNSNHFHVLKSIKTALKAQKQVLIYTNRKEHGHEISEFLKLHLNDATLTFFDSTQHGKMDLENLFCDVTVTTSALTTGKDVMNENVCCIFYDVAENVSFLPSRSSIVQFLGRVRNYENANFEVHFRTKPNENYGTYSYFNLRNNLLKLARLTAKCCYDDISFFIENKNGLVQKNGTKYEINYFKIDENISRSISLHTILNISRFRKFMAVHSYHTTFEVLKDIEAEPCAEVEKISKTELYFNDIEAIENNDITKHHFVTNAKKRFDVLRKLSFSHDAALTLLRRYDTKSKWLIFTNLIAAEARLQNPNDVLFFELFNEVLNVTKTHLLSKIIIDKLSQISTKHEFELARIIKMCAEPNAHQPIQTRSIFKHLRNYYEFDVKQVNKHRYYKICNTSFLSLLENKQRVKFSTLKELKNVCEIIDQ